MLVNKTEIIEKGIAAFPSLFIEGAAACGKSTVVQMFLQAHPEAASDVFYMKKETEQKAFFDRLAGASAQTGGERFFVFEDIDKDVPGAYLEKMVELVESLPKGSQTKVLFTSREKPPEPLLALLWKKRMGMVDPSALMLTQEEVNQYVRAHGTGLSPLETYVHTGGWPGCVAALVTLAGALAAPKGEDRNPGMTAAQLFGRYEIQTYIQEEILGSLDEKEKRILELAAGSPWIDAAFCAAVLGLEQVEGDLQDLERKGLLKYHQQKGRWTGAPVIRQAVQRSNAPGEPADGSRREQHLRMGKWYDGKNCVTEALWCYQQAGDEEAYRKCAIRHYHRVDFDVLAASDVMEWKPESAGQMSTVDGSIRLCYLRGMYLYLHQDFSGLAKEIEQIRKLEAKMAGRPEERTAAEVYLNLLFVHGPTEMTQWLTALEERAGRWAPLRLYHFTENSCDFLGGYRELAALFACSSREESRRMELLEGALGRREWLGMRLARLSYHLELGKRAILESKDWEAVLEVVQRRERFSWRFIMACFYLLHQIHLLTGDVEAKHQIVMLKRVLEEEDSLLCKAYLQAIHNIYALRGASDSRATRWLKVVSDDGTVPVDEENCQMLFLVVKGLLSMNQPEIAGRVLRRLTPYLQKYHRSRMLAETLFQQAIVDWAEGRTGAAVRNVVESFLYTGDARFVTFYTSYGQRGREVLEAYVDWLRNAEPEKWAGKKRYNYGNVLTMSREHYLEMLVRQAKKMSHDGDMKGAGGGKDRSASLAVQTKLGRGELVEKLTLMETVILQSINKGMSNREICEELNLKLPTVKTHISNLYKKLGVSSRVQAIVKGKEIGILR